MVKKAKVSSAGAPCPCGSGATYAACCDRYLGGREQAGTAEALMRSRYTAYALMHEAYLLTTWHAATRPLQLDADNAPTKWIGLQVLRHEQQDASNAIVEFIARYKVNGRAQSLRETSRFVREGGNWFYVAAAAAVAPHGD